MKASMMALAMLALLWMPPALAAGASVAIEGAIGAPLGFAGAALAAVPVVGMARAKAAKAGAPQIGDVMERAGKRFVWAGSDWAEIGPGMAGHAALAPAPQAPAPQAAPQAQQGPPGPAPAGFAWTQIPGAGWGLIPLAAQAGQQGGNGNGAIAAPVQHDTTSDFQRKAAALLSTGFRGLCVLSQANKLGWTLAIGSAMDSKRGPFVQIAFRGPVLPASVETCDRLIAGLQQARAEAQAAGRIRDADAVKPKAKK